MVFKKLLNFKKNEKYEFFKIFISHILKKLNVRNAIFFWEYATCYWLRKESIKKTAKNRRVAYF